MNGTLIVSDTSPLNYLVLIGAVDLLPKLVSVVLIPPAVAAELAHPRTPIAVRQWISNSPSWLQIVAPLNVDPLLRLDRGEAEAISLAIERGIHAILIDERKGFHVAKSLGLEPLGILAVLEVSAARGLINFDDAIGRLRTTTFHFTERLITDAKNRLEAAKP
jgi:predicted nucleic acid-binding protein